MNPLEILRRPEYIHVLINPLPIYLLASGMLALAIAWFMLRTRHAELLALWLIFFGGASAWPAFFFGQKGYNSVYLLADGDGQSALDEHRKRAEKGIYIYYALAASALCALLVPMKIPRATRPLAIVTFILGLGSLGVSGWIAKPGGEVRHPEFREGAVAPYQSEKTNSSR